jgi:putative ABC transport system substrate-binding protein
MRSAALALALVLLSLAVPPAPVAQQATPIPRVGVLANKVGYEAFRKGLQDFAYTEGRNITLEFRSTEPPDARLLDLATELVRLPVDVLVAGGTSAVRAARQATATIPIVGLSVDPVASGLVASLAGPGGNLTGLSFSEAETDAKRLSLLKEAVPSITRVAALSAAAAPSAEAILRETERTARTLGVQLHPFELRGPDDLERVFTAMTATQAEALVVLPATVHFVQRTRIIALAISRRLPSMFWRREFVDAGGLMSYGTDQPQMYRRAASLVSKILQGAKPGDLPVEQPRKFELIINLKTAKALGLTIPQPVLLLADEVIQ